MEEPYTIEKELQGEEKIIWKGKPANGLKLQPSDTFLIPFSLFWAGGAFFWEFGVVSNIQNHNHPIHFFFVIWGLPFVAIGLYITIGRFFVDAKIRANTEYAVTDQRIIISSCNFSRKVKSLRIKLLPDISISEKSDGSGTIAFAESNSPYARRNGYNNPMSFRMIPDVRKVSELIQKLQYGKE